MDSSDSASAKRPSLVPWLVLLLVLCIWPGIMLAIPDNSDDVVRGRMLFGIAIGLWLSIMGVRAIFLKQLRFSVRDVLWLTAVVALACGWWLDHRRLVGDRIPFRASAMEQVLKDEGWIVEQDEEDWWKVKIHRPGDSGYEWERVEPSEN